MQTSKITDYNNGWIVGNFDVSAFKTEKFEVGMLSHPKGQKWPKHYHRFCTEINLLIEGRMIIAGKELISGDVFIFYPGDIADPVFVEDCKVLVIKTPSIPGDKVIVND